MFKSLFKGDKTLLQEAVDAKRAQYQKNGKYISDSEATGETAAAQSGVERAENIYGNRTMLFADFIDIIP
ncbi:MAG: hypothetical protein RR597_07530, partial [Christensenella sp.]